MIKFLFICFVIWFVITRLLKFKVVIYSNQYKPNGQRNTPTQNEGKIRVDNRTTNKGTTPSQNGEYIDYEEVK